MKRRNFLKFLGFSPIIPGVFYLRPKSKKRVHFSDTQTLSWGIRTLKGNISGSFRRSDNSLMRVGSRFKVYFRKDIYKVQLYSINLINYEKNEKVLYEYNYEGVKV